MEVNSGDRLLGQYVWYAFTGNVSRAFNAFSGESVVHDKFTFRLYDSCGASSVLGIASLAIASGLKAVTAQSQNDLSWICVEDTESRINVYSQDSAESRRNVTIVISGVPENGALLRLSTNDTLVPGDILDANCTVNNTCIAALAYRPDRNYFNSPTCKWSGDAVDEIPGAEYFSFYAVSTNTGQYSNEEVQEIRVINSNDPSDVQCPQEPHHVEAIGASAYANDAFVPLDTVVIGGILMVDPDKGVDVVKVKVSASFGLISLNEDYISLLDFNSIAYCYERDVLQCLGSGTSDRVLVFVAEPRHAQMALNGMVYQSVMSDVTDVINITVLDGSNGDCFGDAQFQAGSIHQRCWRASCTLTVSVGGRESALKHVLTSDLSAQVWISAGISCCIVAYLVRGRFT